MVARPVLPFSASSRGARANVLLPIGALGSRARSVVTNSRERFRTLEIGDQLSNEVTHGGASGSHELGCSVSPTALFRGSFYLSSMASSSSLSWPFALT
jgi:hypothetical protein